MTVGSLAGMTPFSDDFAASDGVAAGKLKEPKPVHTGTEVQNRRLRGEHSKGVRVAEGYLWLLTCTRAGNQRFVLNLISMAR